MIKHDQLIGLCDEIAALVRLKIPLEPSLRIRGRTLPRQLGERVARLADQLESGRSLSEALRSDATFPPVYAAVIESGLESGNLSGTLELLSHNMQMLRNTRHFLLRATLYPMFVFSVLWTVLTIVLLLIAPRFVDFFARFSLTLPFFNRLAVCGERPGAFFLGMMVVLAILWAAYGIWCYRSSRSPLLTVHSATGLFGLRRVNRDLAKATFARIVYLMVQSGVPLPRALVLAFQAVGDRVWSAIPETELEKMLRQSPDETETFFHRLRKSPLSSIVRWLLGVSDRTILLSGLRQFAEMNEFRSRNRLERMELWLPVVLMSCLGAFVLAAYLLTIVFPYGYLLYSLPSLV